MSDRFQNKYRIPPARAQWWDYGNNSAYFITICTKNKQPFFGDILNGKMQLSELGKIAEHIYLQITKQFPFIILDEFIIMPDHFHCIIIINNPPPAVQTRFIASQENDPINNSNSLESKKLPGGITGTKNPMLNDNLSRAIRWYKGRTTFECRKIHADFEWQTLFHDHIIRDETSFQNIKTYIIDNPKTWDAK
jgi:REP element-mobilizing transposase RayT